MGSWRMHEYRECWYSNLLLCLFSVNYFTCKEIHVPNSASDTRYLIKHIPLTIMTIASHYTNHLMA